MIDIDKIAAIATTTIAIATTRNFRKIIKHIISNNIEAAVAMPGPLLNVNNSAENSIDNIADHIIILSMKAFPNPRFILVGYRCADETATVIRMGINSNEPAATALPRRNRRPR